MLCIIGDRNNIYIYKGEGKKKTVEDKRIWGYIFL